MLQIVSVDYKFKLRVLLLVPELGTIHFTVLVVAKEINYLIKEPPFEFLQK